METRFFGIALPSDCIKAKKWNIYQKLWINKASYQ